MCPGQNIVNGRQEMVLNALRWGMAAGEKWRQVPAEVFLRPPLEA